MGYLTLLSHKHIENQIAEVTLIGTGGGYGESCVVHLGNQKWMVVDSCIDPISKRSLPLQYLLEVGVKIETEVELVICTHWHDDHILGLSQVLELAKSCEFVMARANDLQKFLSFVSLDYQKIKNQASASSTIEFNKCLDIINKRKQKICFAGENKILFSFQTDGFKSEVISLSPSDHIISEFDYEISTLITEFGSSNKKVVFESPNSKSVALYIKLGRHRVLLGSDLEVANDDRKGWLNIINHNKVIDKKSNLFKVSHHGSINGFHDNISIDLLEGGAIFELSPYNKGNRLPEEKMIKHFLTLTDNLFLTSRIETTSKPKKRLDRSISKIIDKTRPSLEEIRYSFGAIKCQIDMGKPDSFWAVETLGEAIKQTR